MKAWYFINFNERGEFYADVRNENDETIFEIKNAEHLEELVSDEFLDHCYDVANLKKYLISVNILEKDAMLFRGNDSRFSY